MRALTRTNQLIEIEFWGVCPCGGRVYSGRNLSTGETATMHESPVCQLYLEQDRATFLSGCRREGKHKHYRYTLECTCKQGTLIWWHDDEREFDTTSLAARFIERMRAKYSNGVRLKHVTRSPIKGDELPPKTDPERQRYVFNNVDMPLLQPREAREK